MNEIDDSYFQEEKREFHQVLCSEKEAPAEITGLWNNVDFLHCSTLKNVKDFCGCVSKTEDLVPKEMIKSKIKKIKQTLKKEYKSQMKYDRLMNAKAKLGHLENFRKLSPSIVGSCITTPKEQVSNAHSKDILAMEESYKSLRENYSFGENEQIDYSFLMNLAEKADIAISKKYLRPYNSENMGIYKQVAWDTSIGSLDRFNATFLPSQRKLEVCAVGTEDTFRMSQKIFEEYLKEKSYGSRLSDDKVLENAINQMYYDECRQLSKELAGQDEDEIDEKVDAKLYSLIFGENARELDFDIRRIRNRELLDKGSLTKLDELETKQAYDIAFCKFRGELLDVENSVIEKLEADGGSKALEIHHEIEDLNAEIRRVRDEVTDAIMEKDKAASSLEMNIEQKSNPELEAIVKESTLRAEKGVNRLKELRRKKRQLEKSLEDELGGASQRIAFRAAVSNIDEMDKGATFNSIGIYSSAETYDQLVRDNFEYENDRIKKTKIFNALNAEAQKSIEKSLKDKVDESLEFNNILKDGDGANVEKYLSDLSKKEPFATNSVKSSQAPSSPTEEKLEVPNLDSNVPSNFESIVAAPVSKTQNAFGQSSLERVVNQFSMPKAPSEKTQRTEQVINQIKNNEISVPKELETEVKEIAQQDDQFNNRIKALRETLNRTLDKVKSSSEDYKNLKSKLTNKIAEKSAVKVTPKKRNEVVAPNKVGVVKAAPRVSTNSSVSPSNIRSSIASAPSVGAPTSANRAISGQSFRSPVLELNRAFSESAPVLTFSEFSQITDSDLLIKTKDLSKIHDKVIVHTDTGEVVLKAVYEDGKAYKYEIVDTVTSEEVAQALQDEKLEILDKKENIYRYDDFIDLLKGVK